MRDGLRPCIANGKKAYFHKWVEKSQIVPPSVSIGGHNGGVIKGDLAIMEFENGQVEECYPHGIRFTDVEVQK